MIAFKEGWEVPPDLSNAQAKDILLSLLTSSQFSHPPQINPFSLPPPSQSLSATSIQSQHIAQYIEYMMIDSDYTSLNITIDKDISGSLIFTINRKEK